MAYAVAGAVVRQIGSLFEGGSVTGLSDRQLLEQFTAGRDVAGEAAFAALVSRHGPMVLGVCRQILGDLHHAEDAFQAVFLVLARRARSIRDPDLLGNWLYGVAVRTAQCAKRDLDDRRKREEGDVMRRSRPGSSAAVEPMAPAAEQSAIDREEAEALHDEIERLPGSFRLPIILCHFEGLTLDEAARRLRWPAGTLRSRLARAREKLRIGLARRGIALPAAVMGAVLTPRAASAAISSPLCHITTQAAIQFAARRAAAGAASASALALAQEVLRSMLIHQLRFLATTVLFLGVVFTGAEYCRESLAMQEQPDKTPAASKPTVAAKSDSASQKPGAGRMFVVGRVLDPQGKPVPHAKVMVHARAKLVNEGLGLEELSPAVIGDAGADEFGQFRLDAPRTASWRNDELMAVALAPGYGVGWAVLDPDADQPRADIRLNPEQVIQGRLFDLQGRPAQGVTLSVSGNLRILSENSDVRRRRYEGPHYWWARVNDWPAWPKPATTDAGGRFSIHGVSRGPGAANLSIVDSRFARQTIDVETDDSPNPKSVTMVLRPAQSITGRITYADTGKPVPHARIIVGARGGGQRGARPTHFQTEADGRFRANPSSGDEFVVSVAPPAGQPYLGASQRFEWPKGEIEHSLDLSLPRGVLIRGQVTEEGSRRPVAGASVVFLAHREANQPGRSGGRTKTLADGSFELAGPPLPGHLVVQSPDADYVLQAIGARLFQQGQPGGARLYSHEFMAYNPKPAGASPAVNVSLRRGVTVAGRVLGPDDQPVAETWIISRIVLGPSSAVWGVWRGSYHGEARNGHFELHGLNPGADVPVHFFEPKRKLGATVVLPGNSTSGEPLTVRLQPCGTAHGKLVDAKGEPVPGYQAEYLISMTVTPGAHRGSRDPADATRLFADVDSVARIDSINYRKGPTSDRHGRVVFPALIPGATYRVVARMANERRFQKEFTVKPGEMLDLGDIPVGRPQTP